MRPGGVTHAKAAVTAALTLFDRRQAMPRMVLVEAASLGPAYATNRREVLGHFAALVRATSTKRSLWSAPAAGCPRVAEHARRGGDAVAPPRAARSAGSATALSALLPL